jgi:hypothetical protein
MFYNSFSISNAAINLICEIMSLTRFTISDDYSEVRSIGSDLSMLETNKIPP